MGGRFVLSRSGYGVKDGRGREIDNRVWRGRAYPEQLAAVHLAGGAGPQPATPTNRWGNSTAAQEAVAQSSLAT